MAAHGLTLMFVIGFTIIAVLLELRLLNAWGATAATATAISLPILLAWWMSPFVNYYQLVTRGPACHACGYDLFATTSNNCPECGEAVKQGAARLSHADTRASL